jgi:hypothetical protein
MWSFLFFFFWLVLLFGFLTLPSCDKSKVEAIGIAFAQIKLALFASNQLILRTAHLHNLVIAPKQVVWDNPIHHMPEVVIWVRIVPEQGVPIKISPVRGHSLLQVPGSTDVILTSPPNLVHARDILIVNRLFRHHIINDLPFIPGHKKRKVAWVLNYR